MGKPRKSLWSPPGDIDSLEECPRPPNLQAPRASSGRLEKRPGSRNVFTPNPSPSEAEGKPSQPLRPLAPSILMPLFDFFCLI